jgi:hypothetical protein
VRPQFCRTLLFERRAARDTGSFDATDTSELGVPIYSSSNKMHRYEMQQSRGVMVRAISCSAALNASFEDENCNLESPIAWDDTDVASCCALLKLFPRSDNSPDTA